MLAFIFDPGRLTDHAWLASEIEEITAYVTASRRAMPESLFSSPAIPSA